MLIFFIFIWVACAVFMIRNLMVYKFMDVQINRISDAAGNDITAGRDWKWRYRELEDVSYSNMVFQFWRPRASFFKKDPAREVR